MPRAARRRLHSAEHDVTVLVTNRAVPRRLPGGAVVDFIDDLGGSSIVRARSSTGLSSLFWHVEGRRIQRLDRRLATAAAVAVAHSPADAAAISPRVTSIRLSAGIQPLSEEGTQVIFVGNLFYGPNHEAGMWICSDLVPALAAVGVPPDRIVVAGRKPLQPLRDSAVQAGIDLRADVADLNAVYAEAAVVMAPMTLGVGALYKTIDAVGAGRACVLSPVANDGLGLVEGRSALIREREAGPFAEAIATLLADPGLRRRLAEQASLQLDDCMPRNVAARWRDAANVAAGRAKRAAGSPGATAPVSRAAGEAL
jgi:glycosyltransferase involved in cell wall biosynthesis